MNETNSKILITGASGYIGSRIALYLGEQGYDVCTPSRAEMDFSDRDLIEKTLKHYQPDIVIHCAGLTPHQGIKDPQEFFDVNDIASRKFYDACATINSIKGFINASTLGVYGHPITESGVVSEEDNCTPLAAYPQSKYNFEQYLKATNTLPFVNLRIANIPGRDAFINYVLDNGQVAFNGDVPYIRDYIHLYDLVTLFEKSIHYLINKNPSITLNAGSGIGFSFPDIVDEIEHQSGEKIERRQNPSKDSDVITIICDIEKTKRLLEWEPQHHNLANIISYAINNKNI